MTEHMTAAEFRSLKPKRNKYGSKRAWRCGRCGLPILNGSCCGDPIAFASQGEARRYDHLFQMQANGRISDLQLQPKYPIYIRGKLVCKVVLDFRYLTDTGKLVVEDFKGHDNALSRLKRKMVEAAYGFEVEVVR